MLFFSARSHPENVLICQWNSRLMFFSIATLPYNFSRTTLLCFCQRWTGSLKTSFWKGSPRTFSLGWHLSPICKLLLWFGTLIEVELQFHSFPGILPRGSMHDRLISALFYPWQQSFTELKTPDKQLSRMHCYQVKLLLEHFYLSTVYLELPCSLLVIARSTKKKRLMIASTLMYAKKTKNREGLLISLPVHCHQSFSQTASHSDCQHFGPCYFRLWSKGWVIHC